RHNLVAVDGPGREALFEVGEDKREEAVPFNIMHVVPPQSAPDFIKRSPLANEAGWVAVDAGTMQHDGYHNIFALGDCSSTPNSKTAAAVRQQPPIVTANLLAVIDGEPLPQAYDGYAACPITTSDGKVMICEFAYNGEIAASFPWDPRLPR